MRKKILIIVLILLIFVFCFVYWLNYMGPAKGGTPATEGTDLCAKFSGIPDEITCQRAREIALEKYPGEVLDITNATTSYSISKPPEIKTEERDVWIIKIKLNGPLLSVPDEKGSQQPIEEIGVVVDRHQEKILFFQTYPSK